MNTANLPEGLYYFIDEQYPLREMAFIEAPRELELLFKAQAAANSTEITRDEPVVLKCQADAYPDATFLIYWPRGTERIHVLVPRKFATGRA